MARMQTTSGTTVEILMRDLCGRKVKTQREMRNGWVSIAAGTECVVTTTSSWGISLTSEACSHCKVKININKVKRSDLLLIDTERDSKVPAELYFQFELAAPDSHLGVQVEVRCKEHLPRGAKVVDSEEDRRRHKGSWHRTQEYHHLHMCSKCSSRNGEEQK